MQEHVVPRQITTFEFKLIGILTLRQFLYLVIFASAAYVSYYLIPIPFIQIVIAGIIALIGVALAFVPIQDRPLDTWIKNLWKRLMSPTQYTYHKANEPILALSSFELHHDPRITRYHVQAKKYLTSYEEQKSQMGVQDEHFETVKHLLAKGGGEQLPPRESKQEAGVPAESPATGETPSTQEALVTHPAPFPIRKPKRAPAPKSEPSQSMEKHTPGLPLINGKQPYFMGIVKNQQDVIQPGIVIYLKDDKGETVRIMKTNDQGFFATLTPLAKGSYTIEGKDTTGNQSIEPLSIHFDPMAEYVHEVYTVS